ncbi:MAG TPA: flavin reductase family protein, partial [Candidatus Bathyarchaeota archaeon]|nr:flavin reductase family protein [Candidatus Bathyarchaeota archaeon]
MRSVLGEACWLLHPRPTVLVVAVDGEGRPNVMACSWNMPVSEEPPMVAIALDVEGYTNQLIKESGEFTLNIPSRELLGQVWIAGTRSGREVDKLRLMGLKTKPSRKLRTPVLAGCVAHLECKVVRAVETGDCTTFIAEVVDAYAEPETFEKTWKLDKV